MIIPNPESVGLPTAAGNFDLLWDSTQQRLVLTCIAPASPGSELLVGRVYSRRSDENKYSLVGSSDPLESWRTPLLWNGGILVISSRVSLSLTSSNTLDEFVGLKQASFSGETPKLVWSPPTNVWVRSLLNRGSSPDEVYCLAGRAGPPPQIRAQYFIGTINLSHGSLAEITTLAAPAY